MKVLLINTINLEANGISTFILNIASQMIKKNIDVTILAPNKVDVNLMNSLKSKNIHFKEIPARMTHPLKYFKMLKKYISSKNFDIVHVNGNSTTMAIELFAARLAGVKIRVAHSHNTKTEHPIINQALRPLFEFSANRRLACNEAAGKWLFKNKKFAVIPNGINLDSYRFNKSKREEYRKKLHLKGNEILLGHIGLFNYQKNQIFLVELLKKLPCNYKLILIGQGKEIDNVKSRVEELSLINRVIFTGVVDNVSDYLNAMDLFLLPSKFEGQPFVLIESSASGLNNIVSDKVSNDANICRNNIYINLDNLDNWITTIKKYKKGNRQYQSWQNINILRKKGYDILENTRVLSNLFKDK